MVQPPTTNIHCHNNIDSYHWPSPPQPTTTQINWTTICYLQFKKKTKTHTNPIAHHYPQLTHHIRTHYHHHYNPPLLQTNHHNYSPISDQPKLQQKKKKPTTRERQSERRTKRRGKRVRSTAASRWDRPWLEKVRSRMRSVRLSVAEQYWRRLMMLTMVGQDRRWQLQRAREIERN